MSLLKINNLDFRYPNTNRFIFQDFNLTIEAGSSAQVIGINGIGKSTLGKLVCGIFEPTRGELTIDSLAPFYIKPKLRVLLGYYFSQKASFFFMKNSLEKEISFAEKHSSQKRDKKLYDKMFLPKDLDYNPFELSVNEAWRFLLYISMIINPRVLFVDEIPSASNHNNIQALLTILEKRKIEKNITMFSFQRQINGIFDRTININGEEK